MPRLSAVGISGLQAGEDVKTRDMYSPEFRAELKARMLAGETIVKIAAETGIPRGTLSYWRSR